MQLSLPLGRRAQTPEDPCDVKLHSVLIAARGTSFYGRKLKSFDKSDSPLPAPRPGEVLSSLPPVAARMFLENRDQFTRRRRLTLRASTDRVHILPNGWRAKLGFPCDRIEGPQQEILLLTDAIETGGVKVGAGVRRLIVYAALGDALLTPELRERLWEAFELPVFEQLRGWEGELFGWECDAHDGLHVNRSAGIFEILEGELVVTSLEAVRSPVLRLRTGLEGRICEGVCPCGEVVPRFLPIAAAAAARKAPAVEYEIRTAQRQFASAS